MRGLGLSHLKRRLAAPLFVLLISAGPGLAQDRGAATDAITPVEEFSRQVEQLKKSFGDIGSRIEESAKTIDGITDVNKARKEIEALRTIVSGLLGAVSDNGVVAQLGDRALQHGRDKLKTLAEDNRFTREERDFLIKEWGQLVEQTERASGELGNARKEFVQLLRVLQTREDFIDELLQIRRAAEAVNVIRKLTQEIRDASEKLKELMRAIKPPGV